MKIQEIAPGVYVTTVYPGINVGFALTSEGPVAFDAPPIPAEAQAWRQQVKKVAGAPIRYTVLTDQRPERALGAGLLGAPIIAGEATFKRLRGSADEYGPAAMASWAQDHPQAAVELEALKPALPEITLGGRIILHGIPQVIVERNAGAAAGSVWARLPESRVLFAGDSIVVGVHPLLADAPDTKGWLDTLVEVRRSYFPADVLVPGRGPIATKADTRPLSGFIQLVRRRIRSHHIAGRNRSDLSALVPELVSLFPVAEAEQHQIEQRVRTGLERVYEELRPDEAVP
jgi:glyoxylase-like metal-dependent hydrolase (beta-lactamase superfamily II)